jgi:hypothetical protein
VLLTKSVVNKRGPPAEMRTEEEASAKVAGKEEK